MDYMRPTNLEAVFEAASTYPEAKIMAGGQSLLAMMKQGIFQPETIISLGAVQDLRKIERQADGTVVIGSMVTHQRMATDALIQANVPLLSDTARRVASVQIRNLGTWGGNLAHGEPGADPPGALIACGAELELRSIHGQRKVKVEEFFLDYLTTDIQPGEILTRIIIPPQPVGNKAGYVKHTVRDDGDLAIVGIAIRLTMSGNLIEDVRIGINGASLTPLRAVLAEQELLGQIPSDSLFKRASEAAAGACNPLDDAEASASYRTTVVQSLVRKCLWDLVKQQPSSIA